MKIELFFNFFIFVFLFFFEESLFNLSITQKILIGLLYKFIIIVQHTRFIDIYPFYILKSLNYFLTNNLLFCTKICRKSQFLGKFNFLLLIQKHFFNKIKLPFG